MLRFWGKPGKAGKQVRATDVPGAVHGRQTGDNVHQAAPFRYGRNPIAAATAQSLFMATSLTSPMAAGRFRPQDKSSPVRRSSGGSLGTPDMGRLQRFRGAYAPPRSARLGAQSGPSSQPGFPATNHSPSVDLSGLGLPDVWRVNT